MPGRRPRSHRSQKMAKTSNLTITDPSKVSERIALNQLMPYLVSNQRLSTTQSGNKKLHSTETSLIRTTEAILSGIDRKKVTAVVLLDMSKAFDSINHDILLNKLHDTGISPSRPYKQGIVRATARGKWGTTRQYPRAYLI